MNPQLCGISDWQRALDVAFEVAILLLKVLRLQEQPLGPDNLVMSRTFRTEVP